MTYEDALAAAVVSASVVLGLPTPRIHALPRFGLLESAVALPFSGFGEFERFPSLEEKAAALCQAIARNHPLPDGNKRTAFMTMLIFLEDHGVVWGEQEDEDVTLVERAAAGEASFEDILAWVVRRTERD